MYSIEHSLSELIKQKNLPETRELFWARAKIPVKKKKHSTNKSAPFLQDKMFLDKAMNRRLYCNSSEKEKPPYNRVTFFCIQLNTA